MGGAGHPRTAACSWFSGNRQRSGAIKRVICVLQFDPAALGAVRRDRRVIYANSWASEDLPRATRPPGSPRRARCHNVHPPPARSLRCRAASDATPVVRPSVDGHRADGVRARSIVSPPIPRVNERENF